MSIEMRLICVFWLLLACAGCNSRSPQLPSTDKWVTFHCPGQGGDKHVFQIEMPCKPKSETKQINILENNLQMVMYASECGDDGMYCVTALKLPDMIGNVDEAKTEYLQGMGAQLGAMMGFKLIREKVFLFESLFPTIEIEGEITQEPYKSGIIRGRFIEYKNYGIILFAFGNSKAVREPEVSHFFDSIVFYKLQNELQKQQPCSYISFHFIELYRADRY
jgi:hypothetical protein